MLRAPAAGVRAAGQQRGQPAWGLLGSQCQHVAHVTIQGRQRSANVAGDAELEVTAMELEEAEARGEPMPKEASVAAVSDSEEAEPHAKVRVDGPPHPAGPDWTVVCAVDVLERDECFTESVP